VNISLLCTDPKHPVMPSLRRWVDEMTARGHRVSLCHDKQELSGGDLLFLVSCAQVIGGADRAKFSAVLVLHASDLPKGRGWSPYVWSVVRGENRITVTLFEAVGAVDAGDIWFKTEFSLEGHELLPEINAKLFAAELELMTRAVDGFGRMTPAAQAGEPGEYMRKRTPEDSRLDPDKTIAEQFDLLRVVDNERYPAFFDFRGARYVIRIEKRDGR
jgi:methionyl-tRNA formyltransferase